MSMFEKTMILGLMGCSTAAGVYFIAKGSNKQSLNKGNILIRSNN